ncbi:nitrate/sulfonate/bicarbonate ABC transporter ATP-binding protein [Rhizobium wenxiniae]|uniref:NitT/TauT family transport system ATP-binding protein n=1 Tax=Rhizobium wenxiniae TaxID=1737357 RepID=A0A7X0D1D8_9HYPH|nr:ATP-binding cassette domain-containing protein [Rhizobium wenxiniae]MBB6163451.1 NitT/TauT family transport system ATP-binding protein [Rhizobium wenxiniae]GGG08599.1 nitrate/sulfonate/bicarbonate ABC transporter ATP-binding protein [Rhizobium wenxiniae]
MNALHLNGIGHAFLGRTVLDRITLDIGDGELVALVGPSGCGKSTLLHIAAGLLEPRQGHIIRTYERHAVVFQEPRLLPWATARKNIGVALPERLSARDRDDRILAAAAAVALEVEDLDKYPVQLSGGMKQRTAIARALASEADFLFFDEPFTALDPALRRHMQDIVIRHVGSGKRGGLFITHDMVEAVRIAHRVVVLDRRGKGISGKRHIAPMPGERDERMIFETVQHFMKEDPLFRHVEELLERRPG